MIKDPVELSIGQTVHLYPQTRTASSACHRKLEVRVDKDPKAHWPMVFVMWIEGGSTKWELVHRDNIRKKPHAPPKKQDQQTGDNVQDHAAGSFAAVRTERTRPKEIDIPDGMEQGTLF